MTDNAPGAGRLAGKKAIITGGAAGMGRATSLLFGTAMMVLTWVSLDRDITRMERLVGFGLGRYYDEDYRFVRTVTVVTGLVFSHDEEELIK